MQEELITAPHIGTSPPDEVLDVHGNDREPRDVHGNEADIKDFHGNIETELNGLGQERSESKWADFVGVNQDKTSSFVELLKTERADQAIVSEPGHTAA